MNRKQSRKIVALVVVLLAISACASSTLTTAQQVQLDTFNGLKTIRASVTATLGVFNAGYQAGQFNEIQRTQLQTLYTKYLAADTVAATALGATTLTDPTQIIQQVTILAGDVLKFVNALKTGVGP